MTRTNRERPGLAASVPIDNFLLFFLFFLLLLWCVGFPWQFGGTWDPLRAGRDYARLTRRLWRQVTTTRSQARQDENVGERGRATRPTSDAIAAP